MKKPKLLTASQARHNRMSAIMQAVKLASLDAETERSFSFKFNSDEVKLLEDLGYKIITKLEVIELGWFRTASRTVTIVRWTIL